MQDTLTDEQLAHLGALLASSNFKDSLGALIAWQLHVKTKELVSVPDMDGEARDPRSNVTRGWIQALQWVLEEPTRLVQEMQNRRSADAAEQTAKQREDFILETGMDPEDVDFIQ